MTAACGVLLLVLASHSRLGHDADETTCEDFLAMSHDHQVELLARPGFWADDPTYYVDACTDSGDSEDLSQQLRFMQG